MFRCALPAAVLLALLLAACGSRSTAPRPAPGPSGATSPSQAPAEQKLTTPVGAAAGEAVTRVISAEGGELGVGGVTVGVPAGAYLQSRVSVQLVTNTLSEGMQSVELSSESPWSKSLTITMPIDATDSTPEGLGIAVQQGDGSWLSLEPATVDTTTGTVTASLPASAAPKAAGKASFRWIRSAQAAATGSVTAHIAKFYRFFIKPASATVEVKKSQVFIPYARLDQDCTRNDYAATANEDGLAGLVVFGCRLVGNPLPFTNNKPGFVRWWTINAETHPAPTVGTIAPTGPVGATYTAPPKVPSPDTVTVRFLSTYRNPDTHVSDLDRASVVLEAKVKIIDTAMPTYTGTIKLQATSEGVESEHWKAHWAMAGTVTLRKDPSLVDTYKVIDSAATASFTLEHCDTSQGTILLYGGMDLHESASPDQPSLYGFGFETKEDSSPAVSCSDTDKVTGQLVKTTLPMQAAFPYMSDSCSGHEFVELKEKTTSLGDLEGSRTFTCPLGLPHGAYTATLSWSLHRQNPPH